MIFIKERIGKLIQELEQLTCSQSCNVEHFKMVRTAEKFDDIANLDTSGWQDFYSTQIWGGHREYYWFETTVEIPENFDGKYVLFELCTGREGFWDATNPQFTFYLNGKLVQGLDVNHRTALISEKAVAGTKYRIVLSAFTGDSNFSLLLKSRLLVVDRETEKYYYDISVPYQVAKLLKEDDGNYITLINLLNESLNLLDLRKPYSEAYYESLRKSQDYITRELYEKKCGEREATVYCVGHTHIDVAWLWTLAVTQDKAVRSFSTVLELMRQYPEYIFMSSQPQLYKYVKQNAPEVYAQIKQRVQEGRWEPNGAMFLEADCNIASGESLVRQIIHGKRFFREEFGKDNDTLWLPDVFGYSAALPQIMKKSGIRYFMTTKLSWNEVNKMPYDTFEWEGIDGTRVLTHFVSTRDYNSPALEGTERTASYTTYNGYINPSQVKGTWQRYQQKEISHEALMSFGFGDGGGGPTKEMLENQRRLSAGIPGCPKTKMTTVTDFFKLLESHVSGGKYLPTWSGELYLEYHRGTYTGMARNKKYNRKSEFAYQNAELYSVLDSELMNREYPRQAIDDGWEVILRNQFHDILPGSSIKEVYDDSKVEYEHVLSAGRELIQNSLEDLTRNIRAAKNSVVVYNPNGFDSDDIAEFAVPEGMRAPAVYDGETRLPCQLTAEGTVIFRAVKVPAKGYKTFLLKEQEAEMERETVTVSAQHVENSYFDIRLNDKGQFTSIFDKTANRELLMSDSRVNVLMSYEYYPLNYDAWDLNSYYTEKSWEIDDVQSIAVTENGCIRSCLKIRRDYLDSVIVQSVYIYHDSARIDIKNEIDWNEKQIFVKALFPVDVHSNGATYEIQYGNVKRATHRNTSWDFAKFEVCYHKWMDLSEDDYGVSFLNDCKYGCSVHDGIVGLSLLKSAIYPNPAADKEHHEFTFSIYPHTGDWKKASTVQEAYKLNNPLTAVVKENGDGVLAPEYSLVRCSRPNVVVEVVKQAERGGGVIVRLYECYNRRTDATLTFAREIKTIYECDLLENELYPVAFTGKRAEFRIMPYEIKTFRITF